MYLPDINFWLALVFNTHSHHRSAKSWLDALNSEICHFCRLTQQGFLRLANNPRVIPSGAVSMDDAWDLYDICLSDPRISFAQEPLLLETAWRNYAQGRGFSPNVWSDAYLAAFALTGGYEVVTFDQGFAQFANLKVTILT